MRKIIILIFLIPEFKQLAAQKNNASSKGFLSIGINPTYPLLGGYGAKVFYNFPKQWSIGLTTEGSFKLPKFATTQFFKNGKNISVHWDYAIGIETRYRLNKKSNNIKGFYLFNTIGYEGWTVTKAKNASIIANTKQQEKFTTWYSSLGGGYNLFPFKKTGFWIGVQYNTIFILNNTNNKSVNSNNYSIKSVILPAFAPNIYIGWKL